MKPAARHRPFARLALAALAILFGALGLGLVLLGSRLGLAGEETALIAAALLLTAGADALIVWRWDRLAAHPD